MVARTIVTQPVFSDSGASPRKAENTGSALPRAGRRTAGVLIDAASPETLRGNAQNFFIFLFSVYPSVFSRNTFYPVFCKETQALKFSMLYFISMEKITEKTAKNEAESPDIFSYYDYRQYLKDLVAYERKRCPVFSNRYIVQKAGFKSPTALKHVIDGKRNLSLESANRFASALKIEGIKRHYFLTLVLFNQTTSLAEREKYLNELLELQRTENPSRLGEDKYDVFSKWYHLAIREVIELPDYKNSSKWIGRILCPQVGSMDAADSMNLLKRLGLVEKVDGKHRSVQKTLATDERVKSVKVVEFHRQMIQLGAESMTRFPSDEREVSGTTLRIGREDVKHIKGMLIELRKKILTLAANSAEADQIYQLNFQFFPLIMTDRKMRLTDEREDL